MLAAAQPVDASTEPARGIYSGRYCAVNDLDVVVFFVGMRFNSWRGLPVALRVFFLMPKLLAELARNPSKGALSSRILVGLRSITVVQHWRSYEDLERFARSPDDSHSPAWRWFNRLGHTSEGVGIWHETYRVAAGAYESIYVNMPRVSLAQATGHSALRR